MSMNGTRKSQQQKLTQINYSILATSFRRQHSKGSIQISRRWHWIYSQSQKCQQRQSAYSSCKITITHHRNRIGINAVEAVECFKSQLRENNVAQLEKDWINSQVADVEAATQKGKNKAVHINKQIESKRERRAVRASDYLYTASVLYLVQPLPIQLGSPTGLDAEATQLGEGLLDQLHN